MSNSFDMTFTAVKDATTNAVTGVQMMAQRSGEKWTSRLLSPGEFAEMMLASHIFPPTMARELYLRVRAEGHVTEENVILTDENIRFLGLNRAA
ncbi:MAG: hypothetical protein WCB11_13965 [Terriglobales bacterium]